MINRQFFDPATSTYPPANLVCGEKQEA